MKQYINIKIYIRDIGGYGFTPKRTPFIFLHDGTEIPITEKELKKFLKVYH